MVGRINGSVDGCIDEPKDVWLSGCIDERITPVFLLSSLPFMDGSMDGWMMDSGMDGWMDGWVGGTIDS